MAKKKNPCGDETVFILSVSSVTQSFPTFCNPMNCRTPGLPVHHQLPDWWSNKFTRVITLHRTPYALNCIPPLPALLQKDMLKS